ncbi:periplasmic chaperone [Wigglesworthia glossinidia endosymbiont of Glossina morsitans morsitans (Yale colony)]|uniref:Chaperone protein Skp n=1 Tax=Wigglesworthia glossinidia endosymbiont of Glossina morsitans morsitans (Yale colony) TaxID=1142511 RepID=H6Q4T1_WIGGL|nr:OmpH family outer membrane protein [Wigglesworthia glossinidia]AFA41214.1 periplasmic chaperone [Wigglesworthia glossinidia endosymbiont of Glossina morsitans morsitans (Yale colony)]
MNTRFLIFIFIFISTFIHKVYGFEKIAIINLVNIFQKSPQQALAAKKLEIEFQDRATELDLIQRDLNAKIEILKRNSKNMDTNARNALEEALTAQRENFSNKAKSFDHDQMQRQHEEQNKIIMQIKNIVQQIALEKGYQLVIDSNAIIYFNNIQDITEDVLKKMDQK